MTGNCLYFLVRNFEIQVSKMTQNESNSVIGNLKSRKLDQNPVSVT